MIAKLKKKINYTKNKNIILITGAISLLVIVAITCFFVTSKGKNKINKFEVINYKDDGSLLLDIAFKNNKIKEFELEIEKNKNELLDKEFKRENNELKKSIDLKPYLYKNGFGFYDVKVKFKQGVIRKVYKKKISFTKIEDIKNATLDINYYKGSYILNIEHSKDVSKYEIRVQKDNNIETINKEVLKDSENVISVDITEAVNKLGEGTYTVQIDNIINENVRGIPKIIQFTAKKIMEKPKAEIITTDLDRKLIKIEKSDAVLEYEVSILQEGTQVAVTNVKEELNLTDFLYKKNKKEGFYTLKIKPIVVSEKDIIVSENVQNSSILTFENIPVNYSKPEVKDIKLNNTIFNNRPEILIDVKDLTKYKYYIQIKSETINKMLDYKDLETSSIAGLGGKYFLTKEEIDLLKEGEKITLTVYKENISTKEKSYPYTKTLIKKQNTDLISFGYLELENK